MGQQWRDEDITKALKTLGKNSPDSSAYNHVWFKIEEKLAQRRKPVLGSIIWRPWSHPIRWVGAAACLLMVFSGVLYQIGDREDRELGSYLVTVSNTAESVTSDPGWVRVSVLLSEPSAAAPDMTVENHVDPLADDEIFL